jgi:4-hydroxy-tetrahydrodipicolinate synthase
MAPGLLERLLEIPHVEYVKEETALAPQVMTRVRELAGNRLAGVMGGMGGRYMLHEHDRGACGTMPACEFADVHVAIWNALERGDMVTARRLHTRLLPLLDYEGMYTFALWKQVLVRRGVIASARTRLPGAPVFDADNHRELDAMLGEIDDLLTTSS